MRNALWLDSLTILEEPRDFDLYGRIRWRCSFETIRAKALLAPTMGKMKPCDHCDTATPAKTPREVTASDGWTGDVCGNCHYDFHKMQVQFKATENA
jgi:hypothetical protein